MTSTTTDAPPVRHMDLAEFQRLGFLQEANRRFFHPLGLALEMTTDPDGTVRLSGVWDYRDDPEGIAYGPGVIDPQKAINIEAELQRHVDARTALLGDVVQPAFPRPEGTAA